MGARSGARWMAGTVGMAATRGVGGAGTRVRGAATTPVPMTRARVAAGPAPPADARGGPAIQVLRSPARTTGVARDAAALAP